MADALLIRADASTRMGTGHVMRCLSLAQAWPGKARFAMAESTPALEARLVAEGFPLHRITAKPGTVDDAEQTIAIGLKPEAQQSGTWVSGLKSQPAWVVCDGYHFDADFQRAIKKAVLRLLQVDDYGHAEHYSADYILNQNLYASGRFYADREPYTRLLLGTRYVMLRQQFNEWRNWHREVPPVARKVLVTLGGADPDNVTGKVIEALRGLDVEAKIVVGGSNPHLNQLQSQVASLQSQVFLIVDANNMPELMAWADVAVFAGGTTSYELAFMGLPGLVFVLADNQAGIAAALDRERVSVNLGEHTQVTVAKTADVLQSLLNDPSRRDKMSRRGRQLVDGEGVKRVVDSLAIAESCTATRGALRP
jgi:UDP-2,4-diacetamido-2,4,6-trideoxy-beta-L-altropyranose hydrolase